MKNPTTNMANESEGVLDVLREWRDMVCYSKGHVHPLCHGAIMNNLDRIEAAWTREREVLEAHVRSLQSQLKVAYSCGEQPQGNAAAELAAEKILATTESALHMLFSEKKLTSEQFKQRFNVRFSERTCCTCKYGVDMCDDGVYWCKHPAVADDSLYTSEGQTCGAWEGESEVAR